MIYFTFCTIATLTALNSVARAFVTWISINTQYSINTKTKFRTVTRLHYLNLDLKHICSPPSMLLNCPVRQRLWSHGNHILFLPAVKPRWPCICICMYMVTVGVRVSIRVWVRFRVCRDMFRTGSSMFDRLRTQHRTRDQKKTTWHAPTGTVYSPCKFS